MTAAEIKRAITKARKDHVRTRRAEIDKDKTLLARIEKKFGKDTFARFSGSVAPVKCFSTGFPHLDDMLTGETDEKGRTVTGTGKGFPLGKIVELSGKEGAWKSTLCLHIVAAAQRAGYRCVYIDAEHAVELPYAVRIGVSLDPRHFLFNQPNTAEESLGLLDYLIKDRVVGLAIVDSVAALVPEVEVSGDMGDSHIGLQARLMSQALRKMKALADENEVSVLFVNQLRVKIGGFSRFGPPPEQTTGGNALRYYSDIRLDARVIKQIRKGTKTIGSVSRVRSIKNKVAPPFRDVFLEGRFAEGVHAIWPSEAGEEEESPE